MLIFTRRNGEEFVIGENGEITVKVAGIKGGQVRVAIDAPREIPVHRKEIFEKIKSGLESKKEV